MGGVIPHAVAKGFIFATRLVWSVIISWAKDSTNGFVALVSASWLSLISSKSDCAAMARNFLSSSVTVALAFERGRALSTARQTTIIAGLFHLNFTVASNVCPLC